MIAYTESRFSQLLSKLHQLLCVSFYMNWSILFVVQTSTNLWRQNSITICTSHHNPNLFPCWKYISNQLLVKFSSKGNFLWLQEFYFTPGSDSPTQNNISNIVKPYLVVLSCQLPNSTTQVDLMLYCVTAVSSQKQLVSWENCKNLIFHINLMQTAVKKIITTIFPQTS